MAGLVGPHCHAEQMKSELFNIYIETLATAGRKERLIHGVEGKNNCDRLND